MSTALVMNNQQNNKTLHLQSSLFDKQNYKTVICFSLGARSIWLILVTKCLYQGLKWIAIQID